MTTTHTNTSDDLDQTPPVEVEDTESPAETTNGHVAADAAVMDKRKARRRAVRAEQVEVVEVGVDDFDSYDEEAPALGSMSVDELAAALDAIAEKRASLAAREAAVAGEMKRRRDEIDLRLGRLPSASGALTPPTGVNFGDVFPAGIGKTFEVLVGSIPSKGRRPRPTPKTKAASRKRERRSPEQIAEMVDKVVAAIKKSGASGIRAEDIRERVGIDATKLPVLLKTALEAKRIKRTGEKRATTYFAK